MSESDVKIAKPSDLRRRVKSIRTEMADRVKQSKEDLKRAKEEKESVIQQYEEQREEAVMFRVAEIMYVHDSKGKHAKAIKMAEELYAECCDDTDCTIPMICEAMSLLRDTILIWMVMD